MRSSLIVLFALVAVASAAVVDLVDADFEEKTASGNHFVKFYAPWCGHCNRLAPAWEELSNNLADNSNISIDKVDCTKSGDTCRKFEVRGYPTLILFKNGRSSKTNYNGARDVNALKNFLSNENAL